MRKELTVVSLFSGGGLMDLGFVNAGYKIIWANDVDKFAVRAYKTNIGDHIIEKDISNIRISDIPDSDVIIGGFPCQPFSFSGSNEGVNDKNGKLAYQFYRVIKVKKPIAFVAENVKGLTTKTHGEFLIKFVEMLKELGYKVTYETLLASEFGVAQNRERVFIVGIREDHNKEFNFNKLQKTEKVNIRTALGAIEGLPNHENTMKYFTQQAVFGGLKRGGKGGTYGMRIQEWENASNTLRSHIGKDGIDFIHPDCGLNNNYLSNIYKLKLENSNIDLNQKAEEIVSNYRPRRLSARECLRIQSVPDTYFFVDQSVQEILKSTPELAVPVTAQFKVIGNGVPTLLAKKVGNLLKTTISISNNKEKVYS
jgi:DNA (cytosine-5)-methyltransferase 1